MTRRKFIAFLGGVAAWPFGAGAQQAAMPVVGFLDPTSAEAEADRLRAFRQGLKDAGFVEGENVEIVYRFAENRSDRLPALAADLAKRSAPPYRFWASPQLAFQSYLRPVLPAFPRRKPEPTVSLASDHHGR
jgi:putative ABC transport system substrate-binding protein